MKKLFVMSQFLFFGYSFSFSQNIGIGTNTPSSSSVLEVSSASRGLLIPRNSMAGITAISNPAKGLMVYDTAGNRLMVNMGTAAAPSWQTVVARSGWSLSGNSSTNTATNFIGTTDSVPLIFKVNNRQAGKIDVNPNLGNTFFGYRSGMVNITGSGNTATGYLALSSNTVGLFNTAVGIGALKDNTTGNQNTAVGRDVLYKNITGSDNTAAGNTALYSNTVGSYNTAMGSGALASNTAGNGNAALGSQALASNITGNENTAIGNLALVFNSTGSNNTAIGDAALYTNINGFENTATGHSALYSNTDGSYNTATGHYALYNNETGGANTACGKSSLYNNTTGISNTAAGESALQNNLTGNYNTAMGYHALLLNTESYNTAIGYLALQATTASQYNVALGYNAGPFNDHGYNNVFVGANTETNAAGYFNVIAIGQAVTCTAPSQARIGNAATSSIGGYANWSNISDGRFKKDVHENVPGIDFIMQLRPVTYHLDVSSLSNRLNESRGRQSDKYSLLAIADKEKMLQTGFVAQEVEAAANNLGFDFSGVDKPKNENDLYALRYAEFVVPLVKAVQQQQAIIETLMQQNKALEKRLAVLEVK